MDKFFFVHPVARWWLVPIYPSPIFPNCDIYLSTSLLSSTDTTSYSFHIMMIFVQTVRIKQKQPGILISTCIKLNIFSGCYPLNHNMKTGVKNSKIQLCTSKNYLAAPFCIVSCCPIVFIHFLTSLLVSDSDSLVPFT